MRILSRFYSHLVKKLYQDTKISQKYIISVFFVIIIPLLFFSVVIYHQLQNIVKNEIDFSFNHIVDQYVSNINYKLGIYENLLDNIAVSGTVQNLLSQQEQFDSSNTIELSNIFSREINSLIIGKNPNEIYSIILYAFSENFPSDGRHIANIKSLQYESWYAEAINVKDTIKSISYTVPGVNRSIISFMRPITDLSRYNPSNKLGIIKLDIDADKLFETGREQIKQKQIEVFIMNGQAGIVFGDKNTELSKMVVDRMKTTSVKQSGREIISSEGKRKLLVYKNADHYGLTALFVFPYYELDNRIAEIGSKIFLAILVLILTLSGLAYIFSEFFAKRIGILLKKIRRVAQGDFKITEIIEGQDEIGMIDSHFNVMVNKLDGLIKENYIQQLEKRDAELNALQAQINPHFLYNTLELINSIARVYKCKEISMVSQNLGEMFRYGINIGRNEFVKLRDEVNHVSNYVNIQLMRFDELFDFSCEISDELLECKLLKFILQPIVENAITHGLQGGKGKGLIRVSARCEERVLYLYVEDNGIGMDAELIKRLHKSLDEKKSGVDSYIRKSIGITNVNNRIKLAYGDFFGISFDSTEGQGTLVTVRIPYIS